VATSPLFKASESGVSALKNVDSRKEAKNRPE